MSPAACAVALRTTATLLLALAAAALCLRWNTPLPWMIGPLVATGAASMLGAPMLSWDPLRNIGQWTIGCALGLYFTPAVVSLVAGIWWVIVLGIAWALGLGLLAGEFLHRVHKAPGALHIAGLSRITTYFAAPIGGASEMTLISERYGAQAELVAAAHTLRILLVTLIVPFGFQWMGLQGLDIALPGAREVNWPGLALLTALSGAGCLVMLWLDRANPWFLGALATSLLLTASGYTLSALPQWLTNGAQLLIGISLGVRFTRSFVHMAPRWLASVTLSTCLMILLCAGFAWVLAQLTTLHWGTLLLATTPGGIAEMAITAKVLQFGVPVVTAFQVTRLTGVLLLSEPMYRWWFKGRATPAALL
ncbi:MAG: AbrB family transcriptional regulator [Pseudomonadota bacterium]